MSLNEQQKLIVETLEGSINVVAGAGTGKTFTLTQRIVNAVKHRLELDPEDEDPAGHVLAITFTNKAASELKSRVRQAFLEEASKGGRLSRKYLQCALSIDNSWISTIHGMAGRILRENAIEFKIDPSFVNLTEQIDNVLLSRAAEKALSQIHRQGENDIEEFLNSHKLQTSSPHESSLLDNVSTLLDTVSYMPNGLDGVIVSSFIESPCEISKGLLSSAKELSRIMPDCDFSKSDMVKAERYLDAIRKGIEALDGWLAANCPSISKQSDQEAASVDGIEQSRELIDILALFPATTDKFGSRTQFPDAFFDYRLKLKSSMDAALSNILASKDRAFLSFAKLVESNLRKMKNTGATKMSQSDMLVECNRLLGMEQFRDIAAKYQDKFDLIMLDEFQDTDKLQMSLIGKLAKSDIRDGKPSILSNLCTVGDMQQSIYRFRGGDVEQSQIRIESLKDGGGLQMELSCNYRSHEDVLDAVEMVFSQDGVFGDEFLRLRAGCESLDDASATIFDNVPRVTFDFIHGGKSSSGEKFSIADARRHAAKRIASHFKSLASSGIAPKSMALLLGAMSNAEIYASAIRDEGLECAITTGSLFKNMPEPNLIADLLKFATNSMDDNALLAVLISDLFEVSDDALLMLSRTREDDGCKKRGLARSFSMVGDPFDIEDDAKDGLLLAKQLLDEFVVSARRGLPSKALRNIFAKSGLLMSLEQKGDAQSLVSAGTIKKSIDIVSEIEVATSGIAEVSSAFIDYLANAKETPGALVASNSDFIQILTIHSSKGLEFEHVAVAEMRDGKTKSFSPPFMLENVDDETFLAFKPEKCDFPSYDSRELYKSLHGFKSLDDSEEEFAKAENLAETKYALTKILKSKIKTAPDRESLTSALDTYAKMQELDEARRLMYVAMTRAKESLYVSMSFNSRPNNDYKGTFDDVFNALAKKFSMPQEEFPENFSFAEMPIAANRVALASDEMFSQDDVEADDCEDEKAKEDHESERRPVPIYNKKRPLYATQSPDASISEGLFSYTMLSEFRPDSVDREANDRFSFEVGNIDDYLADDEMSMMIDALNLDDKSNEGNALDLGTAFHRIAQASIIEALMREDHVLKEPEHCTISAISKSLSLSVAQIERLKDALALWFGSSVSKRLAKCDQIISEMPFNVEVHIGDHSGDESFVIAGEMDALGICDSGSVLLVDYKTGNQAESSREELMRKYEFQAICYAYVLLESGFKNVKAVFVMVEKPIHEVGDESIEPMCIEYSFSTEDVSELRSEIIRAYEKYMEQHE